MVDAAGRTRPGLGLGLLSTVRIRLLRGGGALEFGVCHKYAVLRLSQLETVGEELAVAGVEVHEDLLGADQELVGTRGIGPTVAPDSGTVLVEDVLDGPRLAEFGMALQHLGAVAFGAGDLLGPGALGFLGPDAGHGHLGDPATVAVPVQQLGLVGVSAQDDGLAGGQQLADVAALFRPLVVAASEQEPPPVRGAVIGEYGAMDHDERVTGSFGFREQLLDPFHIGVREVDDEIGVVSGGKQEIGVLHALAHFFREARRHVIPVRLGGDGVVIATDVVVAGDRDEVAFGRDFLFEEVVGVGQESRVDGRRGGIALDEVAHLKDETGVVTHQAGRPFHQGRAAGVPHIGVARELLPVVRFPLGIRVRVAGVILLGIRRIIVRISQDDDGIAAFVPGESLRGAA